MFEEKKMYVVCYGGKTIWEQYFHDSKHFDTEKDAREYVDYLKNDERVDYVEYEEHTIWRRVKG